MHDLFVTDTARYADYVLPAASFIEQRDLLFPWGHTYVVLNQPAIEPVGESLCNTDLFRRLALAMGYDDPMFKESDEDLIRAALTSDHPYLRGISYERLIEDGWAPLNVPDARPRFAEGGFPTPSGKCELFAASLEAYGLDPLPGYVPPPADSHPLILMSAKSSLHFLNTSYTNLPRHGRAEGEMVVDMHPEDAGPRRIADGALVRVRNERGSVELTAHVGDRVRPGVVSIPHGRWRSLSGGAANDLTSDGISDLGGGGDFYGTRVEVELVARAPIPGSSRRGAADPNPSTAR